MSVNMVVRRDAQDGFIVPAIGAACSLLPTLIVIYYRGREGLAFFRATPANEVSGLILVAVVGWAIVKGGRMIMQAWRRRDEPIIDMDDDSMTYRPDGSLEMRRVLYKDMLRAYLTQRGDNTGILVIELAPVGPMRSVPEPFEIDLDGTNANPEDVCDAIAERIVHQNPNHGQGRGFSRFSIEFLQAKPPW